METYPQTGQPDIFFKICRDNRLKITPQRTAIYQAVITSQNHPTADDIFQIVNSEFPRISFDTVNRALLTFTQIGLLTVAESYRGARRFDPNVEDHHHMHCLKCGKIFDFYNKKFDHLAVPEDLKKKFTNIFSSRVVFNGICSACSKKE